MKRRRFLPALVAAFAALLLASCTSAPGGLRVVTGTALIANIVSDVAGDRAIVSNVVPPGTCPGQYDVKPSDVEAAARSRLLLMHDYQRDHRDVQSVINAANNPSLAIKVLEVKGNWLVPAVQAQAIDLIAAALSEADPTNTAYFQQRAQQRKAAVLAKGEDFQRRLGASGIKGTKVVANVQQAGFLQWAGFDVAATYGRPEELTLAGLADLVSRGRAAKAALVVDNLQTAPDTGKQMARDIGAVQVTISNFPGGFPGTETWEKTVEDNIAKLLGALGRG